MTSSAVENPASRERVGERPALVRLAEELGGHAAPVVEDLDRDHAAALVAAQLDAPARRLAGLLALLGRLDPVRDGVAQQVGDRLGDAVEDHPVEWCLGAA